MQSYVQQAVRTLSLKQFREALDNHADRFGVDAPTTSSKGDPVFRIIYEGEQFRVDFSVPNDAPDEKHWTTRGPGARENPGSKDGDWFKITARMPLEENEGEEELRVTFAKFHLTMAKSVAHGCIKAFPDGVPRLQDGQVDQAQLDIWVDNFAHRLISPVWSNDLGLISMTVPRERHWRSAIGTTPGQLRSFNPVIFFTSIKVMNNTGKAYMNLALSDVMGPIKDIEDDSKWTRPVTTPAGLFTCFMPVENHQDIV